MFDSISDLGFWQKLILVINFLIFIYLIVYVTSKAFFNAYYECKKKYVEEVEKISEKVRSEFNKTLPEIVVEVNKRMGGSNVRLEDQEKSIHK